MLARNETIFKWTLYAAATALCFLLQSSVLQHISLFGVIPFIYPVIVAVLATLEGPFAGTVFAIAVGVACDVLLPGIFPWLYTLIFPLAGLCAALISQSWLPAGYLCSLTASAIAFLMTGLSQCLLLAIRDKSAWATGISVCLRELLVSAVLIVPVTILFRWVFRRTHLDD